MSQDAKCLFPRALWRWSRSPTTLPVLALVLPHTCLKSSCERPFPYRSKQRGEWMSTRVRSGASPGESWPAIPLKKWRKMYICLSFDFFSLLHSQAAQSSQISSPSEQSFLMDVPTAFSRQLLPRIPVYQ